MKEWYVVCTKQGKYENNSYNNLYIKINQYEYLYNK